MAGHRDQIVGQCAGHTAQRATMASLVEEEHANDMDDLLVNHEGRPMLER